MVDDRLNMRHVIACTECQSKVANDTAALQCDTHTAAHDSKKREIVFPSMLVTVIR